MFPQGQYHLKKFSINNKPDKMSDSTDGGRWEPSVGKLPVKALEGERREDVPVLSLNYLKGGLCGGYVQAWPHLGTVTFQTSRGDYVNGPKEFDLPENLVEEVKKFGWGEPPYLEEIFDDMRKITDLRTENTIPEFLKMCDALEEKWNGYGAVPVEQ